MALRPETLKKYVEQARPILIEVVKGKRANKVITYKQLDEEMGGPGRGYIGEVLEEVCQREHEQGRPLLSSLVVHKTDGLPGNGFWELQVLPPSLRNASREEKIDRWKKEHKHACEYWEIQTHSSNGKGGHRGCLIRGLKGALPLLKTSFPLPLPRGEG